MDTIICAGKHTAATYAYLLEGFSLLVNILALAHYRITAAVNMSAEYRWRHLAAQRTWQTENFYRRNQAYSTSLLVYVRSSGIIPNALLFKLFFVIDTLQKQCNVRISHCGCPTCDKVSILSASNPIVHKILYVYWNAVHAKIFYSHHKRC